jgi:hypothetical protein
MRIGCGVLTNKAVAGIAKVAGRRSMEGADRHARRSGTALRVGRRIWRLFVEFSACLRLVSPRHRRGSNGGVTMLSFTHWLRPTWPLSVLLPRKWPQLGSNWRGCLVERRIRSVLLELGVVASTRFYLNGATRSHKSCGKE